MLKLPRATDDRIALSGQVWNRAAGEIERLANVQVAPPLELTDGPAGRRLSVRVRPDRLYWGVVQCAGPLGTEADYSDNRYWVALAFVSNDQTDAPTAPVAVTAYPIGDPRRKVVTATNFFENNDATHIVRPETIVRLWAEYDRGSPAQLRWSMIVADQGTERTEPCAIPSSSSSSASSTSSAGSSTSTSSSGSESSSSSAGSAGSSSGSGVCPPGFTGVLNMGGAVSRVGDILEQLMVGLHFCDGRLVEVEAPSYLMINLCPLPICSSSSESSASAGSGGSGSGSSESDASSGSNGSAGSGGSTGSTGSGGGSGSGASSASSSSSAGCLDAATTNCGGSCQDANLPACLIAEISALTVCASGCQALPTAIEMFGGGTCENSLTPIFTGSDPTLQIISVVEWDADRGCFVLIIAGSASAGAGCQQILWQGYCKSASGIYERLCGPDGGCDANAGVATITVNVCFSSSSSSSASGCNCDVGACPATITVHTAGIIDCTGNFTMTNYTLTLQGDCDDETGAVYIGGDTNFAVAVEFEGDEVYCWLMTVTTQEGSGAQLSIDAALQCGIGPAGTYVATYLQCSGLPSTVVVSVP